MKKLQPKRLVALACSLAVASSSLPLPIALAAEEAPAASLAEEGSFAQVTQDALDATAPEASDEAASDLSAVSEPERTAESEATASATDSPADAQPLTVQVVATAQSDAAGRVLDGWIAQNGQWYFYTNGNQKFGWLFYHGKWYFLDRQDGHNVVGMAKDGNATFIFNELGQMQTDWVWYGGQWYFCNEDGYMQFGWLPYHGKWYYLDPQDGHCFFGFAKLGANTYFFNELGQMKTGWLWYGGNWYLFNGEGVMQYGWAWYGNERVYFDPQDGHMVVGWAEINGVSYYFDSDGYQLLGWNYVGRDVYYFDQNTGAAVNGWRRFSSGWYWFDRSRMRTGWFADGGHTYYLKSDGSMALGWTEIDDLLYYFDRPDGTMHTGWLEYAGINYYFDEDGSMAYGARRINGEVYLFGTDGKPPARGVFNLTKRYYSDGNGKALRNQWVSHNGGWLYCCDDGVIRNAERTESDGKVYAYSSVTGVKLTGWAGVYDPSIGGFKACYYDKRTGARLSGMVQIDDLIFEFDSRTGALVETPGTVSAYIAFLVRTAGDDSHGYDQAFRQAQYGDYDCSSLVVNGLNYAGIPTSYASYTGDLRGGLLDAGGFEVYPFTSDVKQYLVAGDILLIENNHVATYLGENTIVHAWMNEYRGATGGRPGDQTGGELMIEGYNVHPEPWKYLIRHNSVYGYLPETK